MSQDFQIHRWYQYIVMASPATHRRRVRRMIFLLNPEARDANVHMIGGELIHRIVGAALLPGRAHAERLAKPGDLLHLRDPADLRHAATDEIDQALRDQRSPLLTPLELSHSSRVD
jgi:hypothetical protein